MRVLIVLAVLTKIALGVEEDDKRWEEQVDVDLGTVIGIDLGTTYSWYEFYC